MIVVSGIQVRGRLQAQRSAAGGEVRSVEVVDQVQGVHGPTSWSPVTSAGSHALCQAPLKTSRRSSTSKARRRLRRRGLPACFPPLEIPLLLAVFPGDDPVQVRPD